MCKFDEFDSRGPGHQFFTYDGNMYSISDVRGSGKHGKVNDFQKRYWPHL